MPLYFVFSADTLLVPVYDARRRKLSLDVDTLSNLDKLFSRYPGDPPVGSCCIVAYTVNRYHGKSGKADKSNGIQTCNFGHNLQFVIVLATGEGDD